MEPTQSALFFTTLIPERAWALLLVLALILAVVSSITLFVHAKRFRYKNAACPLAVAIAIMARIGQILLIPAMMAYTVAKCQNGCTDPIVVIAFLGTSLTMFASALTARRENLGIDPARHSRRNFGLSPTRQ